MVRTGFLNRFKLAIPILMGRRASLSNPPLWLREWLGGGTASASGISVTHEKAMQLSAVMACVRILGESVATLPLHLFRRLPNGGKERARNHPMERLVRNPHPDITSFDLRDTMQSHVALRGNAYARKTFNGAGRVSQMDPLHPDRMTPILDSNKQLAYRYRFADGQEKVFEESEILHLRCLSEDGIVGRSPITVAREAFGGALAAQEHGNRTFRNEARIPLIIEYPGGMTDEGFEQFKKELLAKHTGAVNSGNPLLLEHGMKAHTIGMTNDDAQFLETKKFDRSQIAGIYRIPPHMIGDLERATFSNVEELGRGFVVYSLLAWLRRWEERLDRSLLTESERDELFFEFNVDGFMRGDFAGRMAGYSTGRQWGFLSANDVRRLENMNPIPAEKGGDDYLVPLNMLAAGGAAPFSSDDRLLHAGDIERRMRAARTERSKKGRLRLMGAARSAFRSAADKLIEQEAGGVRKIASKHLGKRGIAEFSAAIKEFYGNHQERVREGMLPAFSMLAELVAETVSQEFDSDFDFEGDMREFVNELADTFAKRRVGSAKSQLFTLVDEANGVEEDLSEAIDTRTAEWEEKEAEKIAANETQRVGNAVTRQAYVLVGVTVFRWSAQAGECELCQEMDGRVVGVESQFLAAGDTVHTDDENTEDLTTRSDINHPPLHRGCVCTIVPG